MLLQLLILLMLSPGIGVCRQSRTWPTRFYSKSVSHLQVTSKSRQS